MVAAVVEGVVDDGTEGAAVVVVTPREERGGLAFVAMVECTAPAGGCGAPFPSGPIVTTTAATIATAARVAPMMTNLLRASEPALAGDSPAVATGGADSEVFMADPDGSGGGGPWSCGSMPSFLKGPAPSRPARWRSSWLPRGAGRDGGAVESRRELSPGAATSCEVLPASLTRRVGFPSREK